MSGSAGRPKPAGPWVIRKDPEAMSRAAAKWVIAAVRQRPESLICLATGASPARTYELLAEAGRREPELMRRARFMKLDEWGGLAPDDPATCEVYLREKLLEPLGVGPDRFFGWRSRPADPEAECRRVARWLDRHGPIDLSILGLGTNGHLGFNEPAAALQLGPHVAELSPTSMNHTMLGTSRGRVKYGLTLGMGDLLRSRHVLLLVNGAHKAEPLRRLFLRELTSDFPATWLWVHCSFWVFCDRAAAAGLRGLPLPRGRVRT